MKHPKPNSISVMALTSTLHSGITLDATLSRKAKRTPIRSKVIMPNYDIIWLVSLHHRAVFRGVLMPWHVLCVCLSSISTKDN